MNNITIQTINFWYKQVYLNKMPLNLLIKRTLKPKIWNLYDISNNQKKLVYSSTILNILKYIEKNKKNIKGFSLYNHDSSSKTAESRIKNNNAEVTNIIENNFFNIKPVYIILIILFLIILIVVWVLIKTIA